MILKKIYAEKVSNYDKVSYEFKKGITLINGENLSGKSSLLDIIRFGCYGNCVKSKKIEYFKKRGSKGALVNNIEFEYKGQNWKINRMYGGINEATISIDNKEKASGIDNVNKYIQENFISESFLTNSNLCQQKDISGLLSVRDTERFNICKKIFGLDDLKKKADIIKEDIKNKEESVTKLKGSIENLEKETEDLKSELGVIDINKLEKELKDIEEMINGLEGAKEKLVIDKIKIDKEIEEIENKNKEIEKYNEDYDKLEEDIGNKRRDKVEIEQEVIQAKKDKDFAIDIINKKGIEIEELNKEISDIVLPRVPGFNETELQELRDSEINLKRDIKEINEDIKLGEKGVCPTCHQKVGHINVLKLEEQIEDITTSIIEKEFDIEKLEEKQKLVKDKEKEVQEIKENKIKKEGDLQTLIVGKKQKEQSISLYEEQVKTKNSIFQNLERDIKQIEDKSESMEKKELLDKSDLEEKLTICNNNISEHRDSLSNFNTKRAEIKESLIEYNLKEKRLEKIKVEKKDFEKEIVGDDKLINNLKEARKIFEKQLPLFMVLNKLQYISEQANKFLHKIFDKYDISFEANKDALSIIFTDNVTNLPSDYSNLSGFEDNLGGLAIRVGFAIYNATFNQDPIHCFILDEPDKSFTEKNSELLFKSIFELKSLFQQILIVTHKPNIKDMIQADDVIEVKNNGLNSYIETN